MKIHEYQGKEILKKFGVTGRTWLVGDCPSAGRG